MLASLNSTPSVVFKALVPASDLKKSSTARSTSESGLPTNQTQQVENPGSWMLSRVIDSPDGGCPSWDVTKEVRSGPCWRIWLWNSSRTLAAEGGGGGGGDGGVMMALRRL